MKKYFKTGTTLLLALMISFACRKESDYEEAAADFVAEVETAEEPNTESYSAIRENKFRNAASDPLSTFSIDVDNASYSNTRRFLNQGHLPPANAVRVEEFINYFTYDYPQPESQDPFSVNSSVAACPWNKEHLLVQIGLQGKKANEEELPLSNLVFLIDVSGSMADENKLPLLKKSLTMMVEHMQPQDRVSIVVYAGAAGLVLPSTQCRELKTILNALDNLEAGGSTAGGAGIELAYSVAEEHFIRNGNNRIILATDGDFNVGSSSDKAMKSLIEEKRKSGIYLTVLGMGVGNLQDSKMETLADNGNGNYYYIDDIAEAKKVLVTQIRSTLFTIAKDVKIQVEFNPVNVKSYRLIGYENRVMANKDFHNDAKDAGEIGAGHTVTALYEIEPVKSGDRTSSQSNLRYQKTTLKQEADLSHELLTVKLRYKKPKENSSLLITKTVYDEHSSFEEASTNLRFAASVASFGMLLRNSEYKGNSSYAKVIKWANGALGEDKEGSREEFTELVEKANELSGRN